MYSPLTSILTAAFPLPRGCSLSPQGILRPVVKPRPTNANTAPSLAGTGLNLLVMDLSINTTLPLSDATLTLPVSDTAGASSSDAGLALFEMDLSVDTTPSNAGLNLLGADLAIETINTTPLLPTMVLTFLGWILSATLVFLPLISTLPLQPKQVPKISTSLHTPLPPPDLYSLDMVQVCNSFSLVLELAEPH